MCDHVVRMHTQEGVGLAVRCLLTGRPIFTIHPLLSLKGWTFVTLSCTLWLFRHPTLRAAHLSIVGGIGHLHNWGNDH